MYFVGVDPGLQGAFALLPLDGRAVEFFDMPTCEDVSMGRYDVDGVYEAARAIGDRAVTMCGIEDVHMRPGEGAERARNFGIGIGLVRMAMWACGVEVEMIAPQLWKSRLGLPGKAHEKCQERVMTLIDLYYPSARAELFTPRGRFLDGRADALLIAHFLRVRGVAGKKAIVEQWGKASEQAFLASLSTLSASKKPKGLI